MKSAAGITTAGTAGAAGLAAGHLLPALWRLPRLRLWLHPLLAGLGAPGHVALTFDDGPHPAATPALLRILARYRVQATFFLLGAELQHHPQLGHQLADAGHELGVHAWHHHTLARYGPGRTHAELARTCAAITTLSGTTPRWFRPPYGVLTTPACRAARTLGLTPVLWTAWGRGWTRQATGESVLATVLGDLGSGGTILLHDSDTAAEPESWQATLAALPPLLEYCHRQGWQVGPLRQHGLPDRQPQHTNPP